MVDNFDFVEPDYWNDPAYLDLLESSYVEPIIEDPYVPTDEDYQCVYTDTYPIQENPSDGFYVDERAREFYGNEGGILIYNEWREGDSKIPCVAGNLTIMKDIFATYSPTKRVFVDWTGYEQEDIPKVISQLKDNIEAMDFFCRYMLAEEDSELDLETLKTIVFTCLEETKE